MNADELVQSTIRELRSGKGSQTIVSQAMLLKITDWVGQYDGSMLLLESLLKNWDRISKDDIKMILTRIVDMSKEEL